MDLSVMLGSFGPYLFLRVLDLMKIVLDIQNPTTKPSLNPKLVVVSHMEAR